MTDMDGAIHGARLAGADVVVAAFNNPIGRDTIIQFPGGVNTQLYVHTTAPSYKALETFRKIASTVPRGRGRLHSKLSCFSHAKVVSDDEHAPGVEIGRPKDTYRGVRIESALGRMTVLVTGYEVDDLADTLRKAKSAGVQILVAPYQTNQRQAARVQFPGGYVAEIHSEVKKRTVWASPTIEK